MAQVRIVCISDTHGMHRRLQIPTADILVHCGDFMVQGRTPAEIEDFNDWLGTLPVRHKVVIAGNHDRLFEFEPVRSRDLLSNAIYLENSGVELEGWKFWGSPVQPQAMGWSFYAERGPAIRAYWNQIPDDIDVLITHTPPFGTLDKANFLTPHLGCKDLVCALKRVKPKMHIFGHVHGGHGILHGIQNIVFVNCAVADEEYKLTQEPQLATLG